MRKLFALLVLIAIAFPAFAFDTVEADVPIVVPAQEAKTYPKLWVRSVSIQAPSPTVKASAYVVMVPWDGAGSVLQAPVKTVAVQDLFEKAKTDTEIAQAIDLVIKIAERYKQPTVE